MKEVTQRSALPGSEEWKTRQLIDTIKGLRAPLREVLIMGYVQGMSKKEIADSLGLSTKRVDRRMVKALKTTRLKLSARGVHFAAIAFFALLMPLIKVLLLRIR